MLTQDYLEGLMRSLNDEQKDTIISNRNKGDLEWVHMRVSIYNAGYTVSISFSNDLDEVDLEDTSRGYDTTMRVVDAVELIHKYNL